MGFHEEEREMAKLCAEDNIAMTPYSALASGRLSKVSSETSKCLEEDSYAKLKYNATAGQDSLIIKRVAELAERHGVSMTEVSLSWLLTKVTAPVVGAIKIYHIEDAVKAVNLVLSAEELNLFGGAICSPCSGGSHGTEYCTDSERKACLVHRKSENIDKIQW